MASRDTIRKAQGKRLAEARKAAGYKSQSEAASVIQQIHRQNLSDHEAGRRGISTESAEDYAKWFNTTATAILFGNKDDVSIVVDLWGQISADDKPLAMDLLKRLARRNR